MDQPKFATSRRQGPAELEWLARFWRLHSRLVLSAAFGTAVTLTLLALPWGTATRLLVDFAEGDSLESARALQPEVEAANTGEQRKDAQLGHLRPAIAMRCEHEDNEDCLSPEGGAARARSARLAG